MKKICLVLSALALCCTMLIGAGTVGTSSQMSLTQQAITHCLLPICFCELDYTLSTFRLVPKLPATSIISRGRRCRRFDGYVWSCGWMAIQTKVTS